MDHNAATLLEVIDYNLALSGGDTDEAFIGVWSTVANSATLSGIVQALIVMRQEQLSND